jgi:hypothetical protein
MKRTQINTIPYMVSGHSITKRKNLLPYSEAMKFFGKRSSSVIRGLLFFAFFLFFTNTISYSQNCATSGTFTQSANENTYYPGTQATVSAGSTSITLGAAGSGSNFGTTPIASGDIVLIIQMQGTQLNIPASSTSSLYGGNVSGQGRGFTTATNFLAGQMEFAVATNAVPLAGGTLNIASGTVNKYMYSAFGTYGQYTYQVVRVPSHYNIQLTNTITTPLWNGATGGLTVISATNQIDFNGKTINALGAGFRGGGGRSLNGGSGSKSDYYTLSTNNANASKGEGISGTPRYINNNGVLLDNVVEGYPSGSYARGAPGNAGGGATDSDPASNDQNAGGGGGGNGSYGGWGGNGWFSFGATGGRGGAAFSTTAGLNTPTYASPSRLVMGGGGGAGTSNNSTGTPGGGLASSGSSGGGLVIINALTIIGSGTIDVSGASANSTVTIDGSGGAGAGGSILINANSGQSGITAIAVGGDGGSNNPASAGGATEHGPGGYGGGGVIYSNGTLNASSSVAGGNAGTSTGPIPPGVVTTISHYGADSSSQTGVFVQSFASNQLPPKMTICQTTVLPVTILSFNASATAVNNVEVSWSTTQEINSSYFVVERSSDAANFVSVGQVPASQSAEEIHNYNYNDYTGSVNSSVIYYRLKIVDIDGKFTYSKTVAVRLGEPLTKISVYPNPASDFAVLNLYSDKQSVAVMKLIDDAGKQLMYKSFTVNTGNNSLMIDQLSTLPKGIYIVQVIFNNSLYNQKLIKK